MQLLYLHGPMIEPSRPSLEYLECPKCGARYLARDQQADAILGGRDRWFHCHRCNKRVRSAASVRPGAREAHQPVQAGAPSALAH